ncbi:MAG: hypothetical protein B7X39_14795 [Lysobacterales bacterium 14-68-21]|nr:MAG: hypothetical protein B7X39_14795 [Xanthomonadales bacterium 14-68-21]
MPNVARILGYMCEFVADAQQILCREPAFLHEFEHREWGHGTSHRERRQAGSLGPVQHQCL